MAGLKELTTPELIARMKELQGRRRDADAPIQRAEDKATLREIAVILEKRFKKA